MTQNLLPWISIKLALFKMYFNLAEMVLFYYQVTKAYWSNFSHQARWNIHSIMQPFESIPNRHYQPVQQTPMFEINSSS